MQVFLYHTTKEKNLTTTKYLNQNVKIVLETAISKSNQKEKNQARTGLAGLPIPVGLGEAILFQKTTNDMGIIQIRTKRQSIRSEGSQERRKKGSVCLKGQVEGGALLKLLHVVVFFVGVHGVERRRRRSGRWELRCVWISRRRHQSISNPFLRMSRGRRNRQGFGFLAPPGNTETLRRDVSHEVGTEGFRDWNPRFLSHPTQEESTPMTRYDSSLLWTTVQSNWYWLGLLSSFIYFSFWKIIIHEWAKLCHHNYWLLDIPPKHWFFFPQKKTFCSFLKASLAFSFLIKKYHYVATTAIILLPDTKITRDLEIFSSFLLLSGSIKEGKAHIQPATKRSIQTQLCNPMTSPHSSTNAPYHIAGLKYPIWHSAICIAYADRISWS